MSGIDSLLAIVLIVVGALCAFWALKSISLQFSMGQFAFFGLFNLLIGIFIESWFAGTKELVLSTVALLFLTAAYVLMRGRAFAKKHSRRARN